MTFVTIKLSSSLRIMWLHMQSTLGDVACMEADEVAWCWCKMPTRLRSPQTAEELIEQKAHGADARVNASNNGNRQHSARWHTQGWNYWAWECHTTARAMSRKANALKRLKRDPSFIFIRALTKNQESMRLDMGLTYSSCCRTLSYDYPFALCTTRA